MNDVKESGRLAEDILQGAAAIAVYLFGAADERRRVYYLIETGQLPHFRIGKARVCARRSTLASWITTQESQTAYDDVGRPIRAGA
jgi:hypothetical protein